MRSLSCCTLLIHAALFVAAPVHAQELALLHTPPEHAEARQDLALDATLEGGDKVQEVVVRYRGPGGAYVQVPMERQYGDLYRAVIPSKALVPPGVEYFVEAGMANGERRPLFMSALRPARVGVGDQAPEPPAVQAPAPTPAPAKGKRKGARPAPDIEIFAPPPSASEPRSPSKGTEARPR